MTLHERVDLDIRSSMDAHPTAVDVDLERLVFVDGLQHAIAVGRRTQLVDILLQQTNLQLGLM